VDTAQKPDPQFAVPRPDQGSPDFFFTFEDNQLQLLMSTSCAYKDNVAGGLVVWLNDGALFSHFVNINDNNTQSGAGLLDDKGNALLPDSADNESITQKVLLKKWNNPEVFFEQYPIGAGNQEMLMACLPIPNVALQYLVWIPTDQITGGFTPMRLFIGMAALAAVVLVALGSILWFSAQNLILKARFDEAAKQQSILFSKNQQLQAEIKKREQAEFELAKQRTLRIRSDRLRSLGEMAAGIAHELNQPLVGVRGFAELMIDSLDNEQDLSVDSVRNFAGKIVSQADRMVHIINHIRLFARDAGGVETSVVDLNETARSALNLLQAQFHSHGLRLQQSFSPHPLWVKVNAFSVEEVILNLLSNARHAVEHRKALGDESYHPCVRVSTSEYCENGSPVAAVVLIDDNGNGIDEDVADKIFDPFFTTKAPDKGTGLGLSICKSIVESFKGTIEYVWTKDEWTRFEIRLPICTEEG
jgi:C4-dicarboxylate-specific signal transduction histidine kinase